MDDKELEKALSDYRSMIADTVMEPSNWTTDGLKEIDKQAKKAILAWHEADKQRAIKAKEIEILSRVSCCDHPPEDGFSPINVCDGKHKDMLAQLTEESS